MKEIKAQKKMLDVHQRVNVWKLNSTCDEIFAHPIQIYITFSFLFSPYMSGNFCMAKISSLFRLQCLELHVFPVDNSVLVSFSLQPAISKMSDTYSKTRFNFSQEHLEAALHGRETSICAHKGKHCSHLNSYFVCLFSVLLPFSCNLR